MAAYQIPLQIKLSDTATFENFLTDGNEDVVRILQTTSEPYLYLWSAEATGKSHLLQAACQSQKPGDAIYLPLAELISESAGLLEGLDQFSLVCLDDLHCINARADWELGLFHLYNRLRERGGRLFVTARASPNRLAVALSDLQSRFCWGPVFQLQPLSDDAKMRALQLRAARRGFQLPLEVVNYLLNRFPRDLHSLFFLLDKLDIASLQAQRKLTVPFVKQWLMTASKN